MLRVWTEWGPVLTGWLLSLPLAAILGGLRICAGTPLRVAVAELGMVWGTWPWLWMILTPRGDGRSVALVPFRELADQLTGDPTTAVIQIGGNLLVFAAAGALVPVRFRLGPAAVAAAACAGSLTVEVVQFIAGIGRVSSVDDVLLNTAGAVLAALVTRRWWRTGQADARPVEQGEAQTAAGTGA